MTRVNVAAQDVTNAGVTPSTTTMATGGGNGVQVPSRSIVRVTNGSGGAATLTVITPGAPGGNAIADKSLSVGAGVTKYFDLSEAVYKNTDGKVYIDSDVACTVAALNR